MGFLEEVSPPPSLQGLLGEHYPKRKPRALGTQRLGGPKEWRGPGQLAGGGDAVWLLGGTRAHTHSSCTPPTSESAGPQLLIPDDGRGDAQLLAHLLDLLDVFAERDGARPMEAGPGSGSGRAGARVGTKPGLDPLSCEQGETQGGRRRDPHRGDAERDP